MMSRKSLILFLIILLTLTCIEITLRKVWGFAGTVLFQEDENFEYIAQPNQNRDRFGHKVIYNEYSMRSYPINKNDSCVVLGFGDSVINGGVLTDQDSLATTIVENKLGVRFLNISAGSWGPDNCAGYLKKYGDFNAKLIILFVSSHDAHDNMTFEKTVGVHESYPDKQYKLAMGELLIRYVMPRVLRVFNQENGPENLMINKNGETFNPGFEFFNTYAKEHGIPLIICLHAEAAEVEQNKFNSQGDEIITFCERNGIRLISGLEVGETPSHFRDDIHINSKGQKLWAEVLQREIEETVKTCR